LKAVNTGLDEFSPYVSPDENCRLFTRQGPGGSREADLFNSQFYGDIGLLYEELQTWGLKELGMIKTADYVHIPAALRIDHMADGLSINKKGFCSQSHLL
jgi:hypothetical protein